MRSYIALLSLASGVAMAQNQTIPFYFPGADAPAAGFVASVVSANPSTTALEITCPTGTDASECGLGPGLAYSIVSTTIYEASMSVQDEVEMTLSCVSATSQMSCYISVGGSSANDPGETSAVLTGTDAAFLTATITAGAQKLSATGGSKSSGSAGSTPTGTGATGSAATPASTGAAYKFGVEGSALLALAGAAALNAW
ncbi:hypothetical protein BDV96DRAFT_577859 [Lophiotrema nucula]|uniref:GPI anchored cell wall protein n=1 Tax=Lophiotrema nucula TaxID=690887 RepID=A0A6A5Z5H0_9PLEO|nr:hypothetical protein BDV96DRAFT_577859 [Lophiotrema nucula]